MTPAGEPIGVDRPRARRASGFVVIADPDHAPWELPRTEADPYLIDLRAVSGLGSGHRRHPVHGRRAGSGGEGGEGGDHGADLLRARMAGHLRPSDLVVVDDEGGIDPKRFDVGWIVAPVDLPLDHIEIVVGGRLAATTSGGDGTDRLSGSPVDVEGAALVRINRTLELCLRARGGRQDSPAWLGPGGPSWAVLERTGPWLWWSEPSTVLDPASSDSGSSNLGSPRSGLPAPGLGHQGPGTGPAGPNPDVDRGGVLIEAPMWGISDGGRGLVDHDGIGPTGARDGAAGGDPAYRQAGSPVAVSGVHAMVAALGRDRRERLGSLGRLWSAVIPDGFLALSTVVDAAFGGEDGAEDGVEENAAGRQYPVVDYGELLADVLEASLGRVLTEDVAIHHRRTPNGADWATIVLRRLDSGLSAGNS